MYTLTITTESIDEIYSTISQLRDKATVTLEHGNGSSSEAELETLLKKERKKSEAKSLKAPKQINADDAKNKNADGAAAETKLASSVVSPLSGEVHFTDPAAAVAHQNKNAKNSTLDESDLPNISYDQVRDATLKYMKANGKPALISILNKFDTNSALELKPAQYDDYMQKIAS